MHPITETSPLFGATPESLEKQGVEIIVSLTGLDETVSQTIHARHSFIASEILWNQRFHDIIFVTPTGQRGVDYRNFHKVEPF